MKKALLVAFVILFSQFAWGANTNIQNGDSNLTTRQKLNVQFDQQYNVKNAPYNAVGDGSTNDYSAINSAITDACAAKGGVVYFPPGTYQINTSITVCQAAGGGSVVLKGSGRFSSVIRCSLTGYCIDKPDDQTKLNMVGIESLGVTNSRTNPDAGAIRFEYVNGGAYIRDCDINAYNGIVAAADMFTVSISDCTLLGQNPYSPSSVGIQISQGEISNIKMGAWGAGIMVGSFTQPGGSTGGLITGAPATHIHNVAIESSDWGIAAGFVRGPVVIATISGTDMNVTTFVDGPLLAVGTAITGFSTAITAGTTISACPGGNCGTTGHYTLNQNVGSVSSQTYTTGYLHSSAAGLTVQSFQTEAVNTAILGWEIDQGLFSSSSLTATTHGAAQFGGGTVAYSSAAGGTFTFTFPYSFGISGSAACTAELWSPGGYNFNTTTCTYSGNTVTITGRGADPGGAGSGGSISPASFACIFTNVLSKVTLDAVSCGIGHTLRDTAFDFTYGGFGGADDRVTLINMSAAQGFSVSAVNKASFAFVNSPDFQNTWNMTFADLPASPKLGQQYFIIDANTATIGNPVTVGGSPNTKGYVVWNGSAWTLMSK